MSDPKQAAKPFEISERMVWEAWKWVRAKQGAAGVDAQSIQAFEANLAGTATSFGVTVQVLPSWAASQRR